ncbi:unnamed protein product [Fusarium equiseti]|uniref:Uncharacterized protein n=1 Tax=Fusarium equiseti TaxID=61235 RepID=A0A8J2ITM3_FUSEQ|nr:unnamed protein product [Fusarium equiseti]
MAAQVPTSPRAYTSAPQSVACPQVGQQAEVPYTSPLMSQRTLSYYETGVPTTSHSYQQVTTQPVARPVGPNSLSPLESRPRSMYATCEHWIYVRIQFDNYRESIAHVIQSPHGPHTGLTPGSITFFGFPSTIDRRDADSVPKQAAYMLSATTASATNQQLINNLD